MEMRVKPFLKGAASFVAPGLRTVHKSSSDDRFNAEWSYSIFLRHYSHIALYLAESIPPVVAELGPGSCLGVGFCALLCGAKIYYALDFVDHTDTPRNLRVFNQLVQMFRERRPVPGDETMFPTPVNSDVPVGLVLADDEVIWAIRDDLVNKRNQFIRVAVPWT